ncbi:hypothetical protein N7490_010407 [Penicillium lividum]|nr:hypothetical protein N7490_010407 [Penicillium lividum]
MVSFEPGTDIITVTGSIFMKMGFKFNNYKLFGSDIKKDNKLEWALRWTLTLDLEAVFDGVIEDLLKELTKYKEYSVKAVQTAVDNSAPLRNALIADLQNQQSLLLPAAGVFFFKNPILSSTGDLICSVSYDNTSASLVLDPKVSTPLGQGAKPRAGMSSTEQKPPPSVPVGQQVSLRN